MLKVIKRDGSIVEFNKSKIEKAILKAMKYGSGLVFPDIAKKIAEDVEESFYCELFSKENEAFPIKEIEDIVYNKLIQYEQVVTAKAYEGYRAVQEFKRETNTTDDSILELISCSNEEVMKENSNKRSEIASTQRDLIAGEVSKDIARRRLIPAHLVQAHDTGAIHIHDLDYAIQKIYNCCLVNLEDMLDNGTVINEKLVETPKSFETACTVTTQIIAAVASNQYGGQSVDLKHLGKYLRRSHDKFKKRLTEKYGGKVSSSISKKTSYLINNNINSTSSKNISAKKLGVPIITEENFKKSPNRKTQTKLQ